MTSAPAVERDTQSVGVPALIVSLVLVAVVAFIGGTWTKTDPGSWYSTLELPAWNPPGWVFAPVWTTLYVLMAVAAWLVLRLGWDHPPVRRALTLYGVQLALNLAWTGIFFALEAPGWALLEILTLLTAVIATTVAFGRLHRRAGLLLVPYIAWVAYATSLNLGIVALNS